MFVMRSLFVLLIACVLSGYTESPPLLPENLLEFNKSRVKFVVGADKSLVEFRDWIVDDRPDSAVYNCVASQCSEAVKFLKELGVKVSQRCSSNKDSISLYYDRVVAARCDNDQLGCSVSSNLVNSVSDWMVFKDPGMVDNPRADELIKKYRRQ